MNRTARAILSDVLIASLSFAGGVALGLMLAPRSGRETRTQLSMQARQTEQWLENQLEHTQQQFAEATQQAVERIREATQETLEAYLPLQNATDADWDREVGQGLQDDLSRQFR